MLVEPWGRDIIRDDEKQNVQWAGKKKNLRSSLWVGKLGERGMMASTRRESKGWRWEDFQKTQEAGGWGEPGAQISEKPEPFRYGRKKEGDKGI